jgi:hypothetical protein
VGGGPELGDGPPAGGETFVALKTIEPLVTVTLSI